MRFSFLAASLLAVAQAAKYTLNDEVVDSSVCAGTKASKVRSKTAVCGPILVCHLLSTMISIEAVEKFVALLQYAD